MKKGQNLCVKKVKNGFLVTPLPEPGEDPDRKFPDDSVLVFLACKELLAFMDKHFEEKSKLDDSGAA